MNSDGHEHSGDFTDVERRLAAGRPSFDELELDKIKLRAVARASRPQRTGGQTKGIALRSRALRVALSLAAFAGVGIGGIAAFDTLASASVGQYNTAGPSGCTTSGPNKVPVGDWVLNVTPNSFGPTPTNTNITLTATLEECQSNNAFTPTQPTSAVTVFLTCGANAPPSVTPGTCPAGTPTFTSGTGTVTGGNVLTIPTGTSAVTFNVKFSNSGNNTYVIASGSGIGGAGSATDPDAGYDEGHITP